MAREQQGDHRIFQGQPRPPLKCSEQFGEINGDHTSTIELGCLDETPNALDLSHDRRHALNRVGRMR